MKTIQLYSLLLLLIIANPLWGQENAAAAITEGKLTVTVTTSKTSSPSYAPSHIVAIYILDSQGKFVKTLLAYAAERKQYLVNWRSVTTVAGSAYNTVDAVTGATRSSHASRTCNWNGKNRTGTSVDDGTYTVRMELTDNDGKAQNLASFAFTKGTSPVTLTPATTAGFSNITIQWQPVNTALESTDDNRVASLLENPVRNTLRINGTDIQQLEIFDLNGKRLRVSHSSVAEVSDLTAGTYIVSITKTDKTNLKKKFIKL